MPIRAVLFDVGGPLDTEVLHERLVDRDIIAALEIAGIPATQADLDAASARAVAAFAPDAYGAMIWTLCGGQPELARRALNAFRAPGASDRRTSERGGFEPRPGIDTVLQRLRERGLRLGLAANQPLRCLDEMDRIGLGQFFSHRELTAHHGFKKPDVRLFLRACEDLGVVPAECVMVGDRVDNDIAPARLLGMATVLFRTGRHRAQQPRSLEEVPDCEVHGVDELAAAIDQLIART